MISITSITHKYAIQPTLLTKHRTTLEWLSATLLWKRELSFFQRLLDQYSGKLTSIDSKKNVDHFQNLLLFYNGELVDQLNHKLREHESHLANLLETKDETKTEYFKEHESLMNEMESFQNNFLQYKEELFEFIEQVL